MSRPEPRSVEAHLSDRVVRARARLGHRGPERRDREDPPAVRDEPAVAQCRAAVEDERAAGLRLGDPVDRRARVVAARRVVGAGEHDRHRRVGALAHRERDRLSVAVRGGGERLEQVAVEPRQRAPASPGRRSAR